MVIQLEDSAKEIRQIILNMIFEAKASHIGSCYSVVDILNALYGKILRVDPLHPNNPERDYLIMSKGHAAAALYATLSYYKFFPTEKLKTYCQNGSKLAGHVTALTPGVEFSTGSLGHGLPIACGIALATKQNVYVIQSDGECNEGSIWEAALFAAHHKLHNLTLIIDYNKIQSFGYVNDVLALESLSHKWTAFNWEVIEINGHDYNELHTALIKTTQKPKVVIAHTIKGKGVSFMENKLDWHYKYPTAEQYEIALNELKL
jgi:transketolase